MIHKYKGWHVLYVKSCQEKKVYELLLKSSLEVFLPLVKTIRKWSDRKKIILKPLFPSYIFVNIHSSFDFYKALEVTGVCSYIRFDCEYAKVRDIEINKIKLLTECMDITDLEVNAKLPTVGEVIRISHGPLNGLECEVLKVNNQNKILVQIDSIHQNITATIPKFYLSGFSKVV